ncbi:MAG: DUF86 domain-containing protein [Firmicutes bacterium]|nr:DUF86 domain-containing protein [Bacillota bacterium]
MYDKNIVIDLLKSIIEIVEPLNDFTSKIKSINDLNELLNSTEGVLQLRGICMTLQVVGETVKIIDKKTNSHLLNQFPEIEWSNIIKMRDKISHHYYGLNLEAIYDIMKNHIPPLLVVTQKIITFLEK